MIDSFLYSLLYSFYGMTSVLAGPGRFAAAAQEDFLASSFASGLRLTAFVLTVGLILALAVIFIRLRRINEKLAAQQAAVPAEPTMAGPLKERWDEILRHLDSPREGEWKYAVIEADTLVDNQLKERFAGETMGERLMNIDKTSLLTIDGLWEAHKIRNRLAHDTNYFLRHAEAVRAIKLFEQTLKEMEVL
jgi:hypothetical protein